MPLVGTWIEIYRSLGALTAAGVVPLVGTWIEMSQTVTANGTTGVVPLVGTWIEIGSVPGTDPLPVPVVPLVGTWIEIILQYAVPISLSRAPRGHVD